MRDDGRLFRIAVAGLILLNSAAIAYGFHVVRGLGDTLMWVTAPNLALAAGSVDSHISVPDPGDDAILSVDLFSDFACVACQASIPAVQTARSAYGDSIRWRYRPLPQPNPDAPGFTAALAISCLETDGLAWQFYDLYEHSTGESEAERVDDAVRELEVDPASVRECTQSPAAEAYVWESIFEAASRGIDSTPAILIGNTAIQARLPEEELLALLRSRLQDRVEFRREAGDIP